MQKNKWPVPTRCYLAYPRLGLTIAYESEVHPFLLPRSGYFSGSVFAKIVHTSMMQVPTTTMAELISAA